MTNKMNKELFYEDVVLREVSYLLTNGDHKHTVYAYFVSNPYYTPQQEEERARELILSVINNKNKAKYTLLEAPCYHEHFPARWVDFSLMRKPTKKYSLEELFYVVELPDKEIRVALA